MNMKKILIFISLVLCSAPLFAEFKAAPYYSLSMDGAVYVPNKGDWMASLNVTQDIGVILAPAKEHKIIGFYELRYVGPALTRFEGARSAETLTDHTMTVKNPEASSFVNRTMDHLGLIRYHYKINEKFTIKTQVDSMSEYVRSGANELWGTGLYDFNRTGFGVTLNTTIFPNLVLDVSETYQHIVFPNYSDLQYEVKASSSDVAETAGKQDQSLLRSGFNLKYNKTELFGSMSFVNYDTQKVLADVVNTGTDKTSDIAKDTLFSIGLTQGVSLFHLIYLSPSISYTVKNSNQNYQHYTSTTINNQEVSVPDKFIPKYGEYKKTLISLPFSLMLSRKWEMFSNIEWESKVYQNLPPQDNEGKFIDGQIQKNIYTLSTGFSFKTNDATRMTLFYTFQSCSSNMKFEKYTPYNYDGYCVGMGMSFAY